MSKVQLTLLLGIGSLFAMCIPCVGSMLYMAMVLGTMLAGVLAHQEAAESGEDTMMAKVGMALCLLPGVGVVVLTFGYGLLMVFLGILGQL